VTYARHLSIAIEADGRMERRQSELPAVIRRPPVTVSTPEGTDGRLVAKLLRRLADEIEREGASTP
jgi:hypothetical protein